MPIVVITTDLQFDHGRVRLDFDDAYLIAGVGAHALRLPYRLSTDWQPMADGLATQAAILTGYVRSGATVACEPPQKAAMATGVMKASHTRSGPAARWR